LIILAGLIYFIDDEEREREREGEGRGGRGRDLYYIKYVYTHH
jgi:hypothetical protein